MMQQHQITNLIDDLKKIRSLLPTSGSMYSEVPESPEIVVLYLNANFGLIEFCLEKVYKDMTQEQRIEMCKSHSDLHESVAPDESYEHASYALWSAKKSWEFLLEPRLEHEDISMLIRALEYAKYCVPSEHIRKLFMHPIDEHLS